MDAGFNRALRFLAEEEAVAVSEYAIMLALIVVAAVAAIGGVGNKVEAAFATLDTGVNSATGL